MFIRMHSIQGVGTAHVALSVFVVHFLDDRTVQSAHVVGPSAELQLALHQRCYRLLD
jgi:hypothetical protein